MTIRFAKKVFNAEDGVRTLAFHLPGNKEAFLAFNLNVLEDVRLDMGELALARRIASTIQEITGMELTPEEIEFAVEDI